MGRYNFTVGHETGHWQLHRPYLLKSTDQQALFEQEERPTVVCRTSEAKDSIEWQADSFSSCLLMPKPMLSEYFKPLGSGSGRITLTQLRSTMGSKGFGAGVRESDDFIIERFARSMATEFAVSPIAMRIRLETVGFVVREEVPAMFDL